MIEFDWPAILALREACRRKTRRRRHVPCVARAPRAASRRRDPAMPTPRASALPPTGGLRPAETVPRSSRRSTRPRRLTGCSRNWSGARSPRGCARATPRSWREFTSRVSRTRRPRTGLSAPSRSIPTRGSRPMRCSMGFATPTALRGAPHGAARAPADRSGPAALNRTNRLDSPQGGKRAASTGGGPVAHLLLAWRPRRRRRNSARRSSRRGSRIPSPSFPTPHPHHASSSSNRAA